LGLAAPSHISAGLAVGSRNNRLLANIQL